MLYCIIRLLLYSCFDCLLAMQIVVTGGKGFIGSHLVNYLHNQGYWIRNVDINKDSYLTTEEDEFLNLDLRKPLSAMRAVRGVEGIFNLAANMGGIGYITELNAPIMADNARININILEAARKYEVKRIFFSSSACAYPRELQVDPDSPPLKENQWIPAHPDSAYGWEKLFSEILYQSYLNDYGIETRIARFHNIYGPYCTYTGGQEKAPAAICRKVIEAQDGGSITVWGDGLQRRSFLHISDCVDAVLKLFNSDHKLPINIGTDRSIGIDELAQMVIGFSGKSLKIEHDTNGPQGVRGRNADISAARNILSWEPTISLEDGMKTLYDWIKTRMEH